MARKDAGIAGTDRWHWTTQDSGQLAAKFKAAVLECMREFSVAAEANDDPTDEVFEQVRDFDAAAFSLDECAANCHVAAKTLRLAWEIPVLDEEEDVDVAARLERSVGKPVTLARTTIDELRGRTLVLAQLDGNSAIVLHDGDYWGTPADRLVVLPTDEEDATLALTQSKAAEKAAPSPRVVEFLERLEAGLQPPILIYSGSNPGVVRLDVCGEKGGEVVALKSLPPELKKRLAEARRHTSGLVLTAQEPDLENDFYFRLGKGEMSNVLQFLTMMNRTGVLETGSAGAKAGADGCVFVSGTRISHAEYGNYDGVRALAEMLTLDNMEVTFHDGVEPSVRTIHSSTDQMLIEAAIQADELLGERRRNGND